MGGGKVGFVSIILGVYALGPLMASYHHDHVHDSDMKRIKEAFRDIPFKTMPGCAATSALTWLVITLTTKSSNEIRYFTCAGVNTCLFAGLILFASFNMVHAINVR